MEITINIKKEWFEKNKAKFIEEFNKDKFIDEKEKNLFYKIEYDLGNENDAITINDKGEFSAQGGDDDIYCFINTKPEIESLINLCQVVTKYFNKAKSLFENLS